MVGNKMPKDLIALTYNKARTDNVQAASVPTLVNEKTMAVLTKGDDDPFFKIEAIEYPANGSGGVYEKSFFKSFINVTKDRPIPGAKRGHEWLSRANSDFYTVGGALVDNSDGKTGTAYLKIYIPKNGDGTDNAGFIRDAEAGIVHFSLVSWPEYTVKKSDLGGEERHFTASKGRERNDAMEYGAGAMEQQVNEQTEPAGPEENKHGGVIVEKAELLSTTKIMVENKQISLIEIAKNCGLEGLIRNEEDERNAALSKELNKRLGDKPMDALDKLLAENKANAIAIVENTISAAVGPKTVKNAEGKDVDNPAFKYALSVCNGKSGAELTTAIEGLKSDPIMVALNAQRADGESQINRSAKKVDSNKAGEVPVMNV